jgi:hypothetical protein
MDSLSKAREILDAKKHPIIANAIYIAIIVGVFYYMFTDPDVAEYYRMKVEYCLWCM